MDKVLRCIWNIPICGGFCAPTVNPEESCVRHFSNEYTVPASGVFMKLGPVLEWSGCCRFLGSCGMRCGTKRRREVMLVAFAVSFFSWILLLYPVLGLSTNENTIMFAAWAKGTSYDSDGPGPVRIYIGLKGRVDRIDCKEATDRGLCETRTESLTVVPFKSKGDGIYSRVVVWSKNESCPSVSGPMGLTPDRQRPSMCEDCRHSVMETVSFAIMGAITQLPQMTTDLQRSTVFGDVNCQATMGFLTSIWGCFSALMSLRSFSFSCWRAFPEHFARANFGIHWSGGPAFWCLVAASILKLWDAFSHLLVPTPSVRHRKPGKEIKTLEDYMMQSVKARAENSEDEDGEEEGSSSGEASDP
uniref:Uncharacterized protein n=1 Tax=Alexandrium catenella TaxID=2925 RepID=A0A7S1LGV5_ALECA